jgi:hypothetical protein
MGSWKRPASTEPLRIACARAGQPAIAIKHCSSKKLDEPRPARIAVVVCRRMESWPAPSVLHVLFKRGSLQLGVRRAVEPQNYVDVLEVRGIQVDHAEFRMGAWPGLVAAFGQSMSGRRKRLNKASKASRYRMISLPFSMGVSPARNKTTRFKVDAPVWRRLVPLLVLVRKSVAGWYASSLPNRSARGTICQ